MERAKGEIEIDRGHDRPVFSPVCDFCRHYRITPPLDDQGELRPPTCDAFPHGIPDEIWHGRSKHRDPYPGDHGIRFEARPDVKPEVLREAGLA